MSGREEDDDVGGEEDEVAQLREELAALIAQDAEDEVKASRARMR